MQHEKQEIRFTGSPGLLILSLIAAVMSLGSIGYTPAAQAQIACAQTITANVAVLDSPTVFNRLGAQNPNWITYALLRDVVEAIPDANGILQPGKVCTAAGAKCSPGNVMLRPDKRPRPLVVRSVAGACLTVNFTNLLDPIVPGQAPNGPQQLNPDLPNGGLFNDNFAADRCASFHAQGVELVDNMDSDGSFVGNNDPAADINACTVGGSKKSGVIPPGGTITYNLYTPHEGTFTVNSYGATLGSEQNGGNLGIGMFAQLNVQPVGARLYRSQMTEEELRLATIPAGIAGCPGDGVPEQRVAGDIARCYTPLGQPIIDYEALYPNEEPWVTEGKAGLPIVNMLTAADELVHSDINAIIAGPNPDGTFPPSTYPLESVGKNNPQLPNRLEPFREFSSIYHDEQTNSQVYPNWYNDPVLGYTLAGVKDQFMINTGSGGIGSEIISNRLHTGPMHDCAGCAYEEFFLASQTVGDPAGLVNFPANTGIEACSPRNLAAGPNDPNSCWRLPELANGPVQLPTAFDANGNATAFAPADNYALYQEDPSNVHHSYTGDFVKFRNIHAGAFEQHIFHFHNHQWLFNPNDDNANYLDAQEIMPGSGHTYELVNGGSGNRNKTAGDAIFHCHFYPHFAQGMWYHSRIQDMFETGTLLAVSTHESAGGDSADYDGFHDTPWALRSGKPAAGSRALPDAELPDGWPIPAILPLPGKGMPLMPAPVHVVAVDRGKWSLLGGRTGPDGIPEASQAVVDYAAVRGTDGIMGTVDDVSPGFPFWLAGNECGDVGNLQNDDLTGVVTGAACPQGTVGHRQPTPPLDMLTEAGATVNGFDPRQAGGWDGGLPRHNLLGYTSGAFTLDTNSRLDFAKEIEIAQPVYHGELGTKLERASMAYQAVRSRDSYANNLADSGTTRANWVMNGAPPVPGGPFADPCVDDTGMPLTSGGTFSWFDGDGIPSTLNTKGGSAWGGENPRTYKLANVQLDAVFNKIGYHYPQERIIALWADVGPSVAKERPPEPLVMRFNTFDCGKILHANLVPKEFEVDDFQVRTPTDIIGQHIHLPKWDLTTNDGAANGWNYEDGALAPGMVQERITAINHYNELVTSTTFDGTLVGAAVELGFAHKVPQQVVDLLGPSGTNAAWDVSDLAPVPTLSIADGADPGSSVPAGATHLEALPHPFFQNVVNTQDYLGARTVIQRLMVDPVVNVAGVDRGLGLTFSHDHYGPSTFQQIGLYSTILAEPAGSTWVHNETGEALGWAFDDGADIDGYRDDGGPTSWQAAILPPAAAPNGSTVRSEDIPDHREFYFEMSDFQHAYEKGVYIGADAGGKPKHTTIVQPNVFNVVQAEVAGGEPLANSWRLSVNPPLKVPAVGALDGAVDAGGPNVVKAEPNCPGDGVLDPATGITATALRPCAEAINISHSSMWVTNYRNEPVGLRVFDPSRIGPDGVQGAQALGQAGDLALAFESRRDRAIPQLNTSFGEMPYPTTGDCDGINCDRRPGDPITPIMRAYERDEIKVKVQVGATEEQHQVTVHGMKWLSNGSGFGRSPNSGWRNFQSHGISEQFSLQVPFNPDPNQRGNTVDYLYATDATRDGIWSGTWGILRSYGAGRDDLFELPENPAGPVNFANQGDFNGVCPASAEVVRYDVVAVLANKALPNSLGVDIVPQAPNPVPLTPSVLPDPDGGTLVYNRRQTVVPDVTVAEGGENIFFGGGAGPLNDPTGMLYTRLEDLEPRFIAGVSPDGNLDGIDDRCQEASGDPDMPFDLNLTLEGCPVQVAAGAPVEPVVLRANAGQCVEVVLHNKLIEQAVADVDNKLVYACDDDGTGYGCVTNTHTPLFDIDQTKDYRGAGRLVMKSDATGDYPVADDDIVFDQIPDMAGWQGLMWVVNRELFEAQNMRGNEMHFFNNNLIRPSANVGLHAQLVEYDMSRDDGLVVGINSQDGIATPGGQTEYRWYAGDLSLVDVKRRNQTRTEIVATPVEFGGTNLLSADRVKQPQKGLFGALVIEPAGATYDESTQVADGQGTGTATRLTRAQASISSLAGDAGSGGDYREALAIGHKITNLRWADGTAIKNVNQEEMGREGAEDSGHAGFNYGMEPPWFRFQLPPNVPWGNAGQANTYGAIPNQHAFYANQLVTDGNHPNYVPAIPGVSEAGDPATPVFRAQAGAAARMHVLNGASADRDGTWMLHGHLWQRDPFVCTGGDQDATVALAGRCAPDAVASQALGLNPQGKWMATEEGMGHAYGHWPILLQSAGGTNAVQGDYLFRDYAPNGNRNGQFGILRVQADAPTNGGGDTGGGDTGGGGTGGGGKGGGKKK